jgi:L-ascorbate metabolism protein UlaG (beta-lactamase superfamily)
MFETFGKRSTGERLKRIEHSVNYKEGSFQNIEPTPMLVNTSWFKLIKDLFNKPKNVSPAQHLPNVKTDLKQLPADKPVVIWFGHSSYLISYNGFTILVDPVFSGSASPFSFMVKAFKGANDFTVADLPAIDVLLLTHDHYDHLDHRTIKKLNSKTKQIITSLGVGSHLEYWGIPKEKITELDWWDTATINTDVTFTAAPARHFSGRGLTRGKTFWSSFILNLFGYRLFLGGDSGYDKQFELIGKKFGSFDLAILETGQYNVSWPFIHMMPEQAVQAAKDLNAKVLLPVHWSKFALAYHPWNEPPERVTVAAKDLHQQVVIPMIGQPYIIGEAFEQQAWWNVE